MTLSKMTVALWFLALTGCASYDLRTATGDLRPLPDGRYEAKLAADAAYPDNDPAAEQRRLTVLSGWMSDNGYCPAGWDVENRTATLRTHGAFGDVKDIYYVVRCNA